MRHYAILMTELCFLTVTFSVAVAQTAPPIVTPPPTEAKPLKATFLITGLHCPPCSTTVEQSLKSIKGVRSAKVDWASKNAQVEFDERQVTAQQIATRIATTRHMMGGNMVYAGWLALRVPEIAAEGNTDKAKAVLLKVKGVSNVAIYPKQKSVGIEFASEGSVTSEKLIEALKSVELEASHIP